VWLLWRARPELLPTGSGPDLVHHLALIDYIEQHWRLVHDVRLSEYLGEMVDYTPGFHLLAALVAAWIPGDALHVVYAVVATTVALKFGIVFLIARRLLQVDVPRDPFALVAVLLLLVPRVYSIGSFTEQSYLAQVVAELFAIAAWWMVVVWDEQPWPAAMALFALFGTAGFLVWPVWTGPLMLVVFAVALLRSERSLVDRARQLVPAVCAIAPSGRCMRHTISVAFGWRALAGSPFRDGGGCRLAVFRAVAAAVVAAAFRRPTRVLVLLAAAIALTAVGLLFAARSSGAAAPYLAIKMFYLAIYPWRSPLRCCSPASGGRPSRGCRGCSRRASDGSSPPSPARSPCAR